MPRRNARREIAERDLRPVGYISGGVDVGWGWREELEVFELVLVVLDVRGRRGCHVV